jgi:hypothetical protein
MFEKYVPTTEFSSRGSLGEIWLDKEAKLVKKIFKPNAVSIKNRPTFHRKMEEITKLYENEIYWTNKLKSKFLIETYEHGSLTEEEGFYLIQEYAGPDLLHYELKTVNTFPDIVNQLDEMFSFFKENEVYKMNNAKCNLAMNNNGQLKCFDFKYAVPREPKKTMLEMLSVKRWLSNIDESVIPKLSKHILI